jgi:hypothetical protein
MSQEDYYYTQVRGELENLTETIEDMLGQLEDDGQLDEDEGANILLKLLTKTDMPTPVDMADQEATSGLSLIFSSQLLMKQETRSRVQAETSMNSQSSRRDRKNQKGALRRYSMNTYGPISSYCSMTEIWKWILQ